MSASRDRFRRVAARARCEVRGAVKRETRRERRRKMTFSPLDWWYAIVAAVSNEVVWYHDLSLAASSLSRCSCSAR